MNHVFFLLPNFEFEFLFEKADPLKMSNLFFCKRFSESNQLSLHKQAVNELSRYTYNLWSGTVRPTDLADK